MHDPETLAWEIKSPLKTKLKDGFTYRRNILEIWHTDPEKDGSDDSCGWSYPRLTKAQLKECESIASDVIITDYDKQENGKYKVKDPRCAVYAAYTRVGWRLFRKQRLSAKHLDNLFGLMYNLSDNICPSTREMNFYDIERLVWCAARSFARVERPWWKHPRFHVHHLRINIPFMAQLKRWLFSRCCKCGKGFSWGYTPTTDQWHSKGPRWFKGEANVYHHDCKYPKSHMCEAVSNKEK
jgi:hypothetical protein